MAFLKYQLASNSLFQQKSILFSLKNSFFFLLVAFINAFTPIALCIISSYINPYGAQAVMGVGYVAVFLMSFGQVGISFATSTYFLTKNKMLSHLGNKQSLENEIMSRAFITSLAMGLFLTLVYCLSSYLYIHYSCDRPNTIQTLNYGIEFMYSSFPYVLLICLHFLLVLYIKMKNRKLSTIIQCGSMLFIILFAAILGVHTNLEVKGIGLGCSLGLILSLLIVIVVIYFKYPIKFKYIRLKYRVSDLKEIISESVSGVSSSFFKGTAILILALAMPVQLGDFVPLSYQMARLIWFNLMYSVVWFAVGVSDTIKYHSLIDDGSLSPKQKIAWFNKLTIVSFVVTLIFCVIGWFVIEPLASIYIQNGTYAEWLQKPTAPSSLQTIIEQADGVFSNFVGESFNNATTPIDKLKAVMDWINKAHDTPQGRLEILQMIAALAKINISTENLLDFFKYIVDYKGFTSYSTDIIVGLLNHSFKGHDLLVTIGLQGYNANSSFYIFIYALLCSIWTVLMPAKKAITKKGIPNIVIALVYAFAIGFLIYFGVHYSLIDNKIGNTFRFLDAWTFPLMIIAIAVFIFITIGWTHTIIHVYKNDKNTLSYWIRIIKKQAGIKGNENLILATILLNCGANYKMIKANNEKITLNEINEMVENNFLKIKIKDNELYYVVNTQHIYFINSNNLFKA